MQYRLNETWHRLRDWTAGQAPSEQLAAQILMYEGNRDLDPTHPNGGRDGGKDAVMAGRTAVMAVYFPLGQHSFTDIKSKFRVDLQGAINNKASKMAWVTNQAITDGQRRELEEIGSPLAITIYHLDRIASILDTPEMEPVRRQFLQFDRRDLNPVLNPADGYVQLSGNYSRAQPAAHSLVTTFLPPQEFLDYLTNYDFRSGRIPIDKQTAIGNLYTEIAFVQGMTEGRDVSQNPEIRRALQSSLRMQVLTALPALGVFFERLQAHYISIYQVTATEMVPNPTHLGIFGTPEEINPNAEGFSGRVFEWEQTARALATAYKTEILGESVY